MKKVISVVLFCMFNLIFCVPLYAKDQGESLDQIAAIVNDDVITVSELNHALKFIKVQLAQENMPLPSEQVLQKQMLEQLINKKLQLQIAKQAGIKVSTEELNKVIENVAKQNHLSVTALYDRLTRDGLSVNDYRQELHDQIILQRLQQQEVISHINISPEEVTSFMHSQSWHNNGTKEYHLEDILIALPDAPSSEQIATAKKHADLVLEQLNQGKSFKEIAQAESNSKNALQGGDLGWRKLPEIPSAFAEQVIHMQTKEIAGPIQTPNGFHIIRLVEKRDAGEHETPPSRKQVQALLLQRKFEEALQNWLSRLHSQAFIVNKLA